MSGISSLRIGACILAVILLVWEISLKNLGQAEIKYMVEITEEAPSTGTILFPVISVTENPSPTQPVYSYVIYLS